MPVVITAEGSSPILVTAGQRAVIGRDQNLDVTVAHPRVSRQHAEVLLLHGSWIFRDLDTPNGTYLDGKRVTTVSLDGPITITLGGTTGPRLVVSATPELESDLTVVGDEPEKSGDIRHLTLPPLLTLGSDISNDIVISETGVAAFHASITRTARGVHEIVATSPNSTFINDDPIIKRSALKPGDVIRIGGFERRYTGNALETVDATGGFSFIADTLGVVAGGKTLLDDISFHLRPRTLTAVIGPSGAGKSTLLGALTGRRPATTGKVLVGGHDLYSHYDTLRNRIDLVPQSDLLHTNLTTRQALRYAAALRFPRGVSKQEQESRVDEVIDLLGLSERRNLPIHALSGGQRKRASVALELLTEPELLFLDEPTSGLDPGLDRQVMNQLRGLANGGRTVLVVTHSVANLDVCDEVILLAPGGKLAYHGPSHQVLDFFDAQDWAEVFDKLSTPNRPTTAPATTTVDTHVEEQTAPLVPVRGQFWPAQLWHLVRRYVHVISTDKYFLALLAVLPFVLAMVGFSVGNDYGFGPGPEDEGGLNLQARPLLLVLILGASFMGLSASVQELVKERTIYERERSVGLSAGAYVVSKILVLGVIVVAQTTIFVLITLADREMPEEGVVLDNPLLEVLVVTLGLAVLSLLLGLLISAIVNSSEVTMPALVLATMAQVVLSGAVPIRQSGLLDIVGLPNPGYWAMNAMANTADLNVISALTEDDQGAFWESTSENWMVSSGVLAGFAIALIIATRVILMMREKRG